MSGSRTGEAPALLVEVAAAVIERPDGTFLMARRPEGKAYAGWWEFPGGKIEAGERPEETLIRELKEELGILVREPCLAPLTFASHAYDDFHLLMPLYVCRRWEGIAAAQEGQHLGHPRLDVLGMIRGRHDDRERIGAPGLEVGGDMTAIGLSKKIGTKIFSQTVSEAFNEARKFVRFRNPSSAGATVWVFELPDRK